MDEETMVEMLKTLTVRVAALEARTTVLRSLVSPMFTAAENTRIDQAEALACSRAVEVFNRERHDKET